MIGSWLIYIASTFTLYFGSVYLFLPKFTKYHKAALQKEWSELERETRILILALMRATGGGLMATGTGMALLQYAFTRFGHPLLAWLILIIGSIATMGSFYAMFSVRLRTKGRPPVFRVLLVYIILLAGFLFNILG
jgi:hypothetical protein